MTARLADAMCRYHRRWTVENRMWRDSMICAEGCETVTGVILLPHLNLGEQLAIHEAGHAVAFLALGEGVLEAVADLDNLPGSVRTVSTTCDARGVLAGAAAVTRWAQPDCDEDFVDIANGAQHDFRNMWNAGVSIETATQVLRQADDIVAALWPAIERVAEVLLTRGRLTGDEIADLAGIRVPA